MSWSWRSVSASFKVSTAARLSVSMTSRGVPAGATSPCHVGSAM
jgi:hypothetical protein